LPETRKLQAELASDYGIHGFCYYHYWFGGKRLLERPFEEVLATGEPDFPFCLCWANENWTRRWDGHDQEILMAQKYSEADDIAHLRSLIPAFSDPRYIKIHGKPVFLVYRSNLLPQPLRTTDLWREVAQKEGIGELFLCRVESTIGEEGDPAQLGFDAAVEFQPEWGKLLHPMLPSLFWRLKRKLGFKMQGYPPNRVFDYVDYVNQRLQDPPRDYLRFPCVTPSWDNSARRAEATILINSNPETYQKWLTRAVKIAPSLGNEPPVVFVNAWNEWGEGNHLEPCQKWERAYLEATRCALLQRF
jgi:lipopolysaccharide biosynthesis protein